jgi:predicted ATPase
LAKLVSAGILYLKGQPPACHYLFRHALLEEALHSAIDLPKRRRFHQQVAEVMEERFPHLVETQPELLAEHFTEAGIIEKAIGYCLRAGLRSRDRSAHVEAISHLTKGLKLLETLVASPERDSRELELLGPLGTAYIASRGWTGWSRLIGATFLPPPSVAILLVTIGWTRITLPFISSTSRDTGWTPRCYPSPWPT